ncbi:hypothetical protein [Methylobacterium sp. GC_Met_2]|uniref:hypothetical protein n=1 Tax=Methylobacterium sp. GC_Met_2 TaxID=2937376 RepID=UPI00226B140D|nr:hypothetical protein [Methylobacterium sp. GC_Met_2]
MVTGDAKAGVPELIRAVEFDVKSYTAGRRVVRIEAFGTDYVISGRIGFIEIFLDDDGRGLVTGDWDKNNDAAMLKTALDFLLRDGYELYEV